QALEDAGSIVVDYYVGAAHQLQQEISTLGALQVESDRSHAAVPAEEAEARAGAKRIAAKRLDLDHLGAEIREKHRAERAGDEGGEVHHADAVERGRRRARALDVPRMPWRVAPAAKHCRSPVRLAPRRRRFEPLLACGDRMLTEPRRGAAHAARRP